ncbi:MAG: CpcT/CpeT family chromophore lyase [Xanthomonadales bacterium]|nr:CpcT/CpeT family chromophore lyase [Xanthomonadales bacterium]
MNYFRQLALLLTIGLLFGLLSGCSSQETRPDNKQKTLGSSEVLQQLQRHLPGHYSNFAQQWLDPQQPLRLLDVSLIKASETEIWMLTRQRQVNSQQQEIGIRQQILAFTATTDDEIKFRFAPHKGAPSAAQVAIASGQVAFLPGCEVSLYPGKDGLLGKTSERDCKLPGSDDQNSLSKSIKIQAGIITIADQLIRNGEPQGDAVIQQFYRSQIYSGWAGLKNPHSDWQPVVAFELFTDGEVLALLDQDGKDTGLHIRLSQVPWKKGERMILRLDLIDPQTGKPSAYVFSDPDAENIGLNLGEVQVGLKRK